MCGGAALLLASLTLSAAGTEVVVTGNQTVSADLTTDDYFVIGSDTESGSLTVNGGATVTVNGYGVNSGFRNDKYSCWVKNGSLNVENATVIGVGGNLIASAAAGNSAVININNGGLFQVGDVSHPCIGANLGESGVLNINAGGKVDANCSFYIGGHGTGTVNLADGGNLTIGASGGLQIGRDYSSLGACDAYFNMTGGTLDVGKYLIIGYNNKTNPDHVNYSEVNITGGNSTIRGAYVCIANNNRGEGTIAPQWIESHLNIGGDAQFDIVSGILLVGCGEGAYSANAEATGFFTVSDSAAVNMGGSVVANGTYSTFTMNGGTFTATNSALAFTNYGTMNLNAGTLTLPTGKAVTNNGTLNFNGGTLAANLLTSSSGTSNVVSGDSTITGTLQVGDAASAGSVVVSGGILTVQGSETIVLQNRNATPSVSVVNGMLTVNSGTLKTDVGLKISGSGDDPSTAVMVVNGGNVEITNYTWVGLEHGTTGSLIINDGSFTSKKSFYCGYNGTGFVQLNGGALTVASNFQIGRNYDNYSINKQAAVDPAQGPCDNPGSEGYFTMTGGTLTVTGGMLVGRYGKLLTNTQEGETIGVFTMSGGTATVGGSLSIAGDALTDTHTAAIGLFSLSGNSQFTLGGNLSIGNGEGSGSIVGGGNGSLSIYDDAVMTVKSYTGIGNANASLNLYGGEFKAEGKTVENTGEINFEGGVLTAGTVTNNANSSINFTAGVNGFGSANVTGTMTNNGTINVGVDGVGLLKGYDAANGLTLMTTGGTAGTGSVVNENTTLTNAAWSGNDLNFKFTGASSGTLSAICDSLTLATPSQQGWISLTDFGGKDPFEFTLNFSNVTTQQQQDDLLEAINSALTLGDEKPVTASAGDSYSSVVLSGLSSDLLGANVFAWDFTAAAYGDAALSGIASIQTPEPTSWALLVLGIFGIAFIRKQRR